jgi:hypothetical protein
MGGGDHQLRLYTKILERFEGVFHHRLVACAADDDSYLWHDAS